VKDRLNDARVKFLKLGVAVKRTYFPRVLPREATLDPIFVDLHRTACLCTMTSWERLHAAFDAVKYVVNNQVPGSIVECGVWKGGSSMVMAGALARLGDTSRDVYLFDTFTGMTEPVSADGDAARLLWSKNRKADVNLFCYSPLEEVQNNMRTTGYPESKLHFVKGPVEQTLPGTLPDVIAVLRLDTDWFESTYHELTHLYPRLARNGILIVDDYGDWQGARLAVDQYFREQKINPLLTRIDATGRLMVKLT
jgi:hypothetical protein